MANTRKQFVRSNSTTDNIITMSRESRSGVDQSNILAGRCTQSGGSGENNDLSAVSPWLSPLTHPLSHPPHQPCMIHGNLFMGTTPLAMFGPIPSWPLRLLEKTMVIPKLYLVAPMPLLDLLERRGPPMLVLPTTTLVLVFLPTTWVMTKATWGTTRESPSS